MREREKGDRETDKDRDRSQIRTGQSFDRSIRSSGRQDGRFSKTSSASLFSGTPSSAVPTRAGTSTLVRCPSSISCADRVLAYPPRCPEGWFWKSCRDPPAPAGHRTTRRPPDHRRETQTAVVWSCLPFLRSGQNHLARHSERWKKTRQTEEEVDR